jgi:hypothetical protein
LRRMNERLSARDFDGCLLLLERALVQIRAACWSQDIAKAEALADAFHNLPRLLMEQRDSWTVEGFETLFLGGLIEKYPEFSGLQRELASARGTVSPRQ